MNRKLILASIVVIVTCLAFTAPASESDADGPTVEVLIDKGNGQTYWTTAEGNNLNQILSSACSKLSMSFSSSDSTITIDGLTSRTIGETVCKWNYYEFSDSWVKKTYSGSASYSGTAIALGFYTDSLVPTVTPTYKDAWTMIHADAMNSGSVNVYQPSEDPAEIYFTHGSAERIKPACYSSALYENGHIIFTSEDYSKKPSDSPLLKSRVICYDAADGSVIWEYLSDPIGYELASGAIFNNHVYFVKNNGYIYSIPISGTGAGTVDHSYKTTVIPIPTTSGYIETGVSSVVYDSGHIFIGSTSGTITCLTPDLEMVWTSSVDGAVYPSSSLTVADGRVYIGDCKGFLTILNESNGNVLAKKLVYFDESGRVNPPAVLGEYIIASYSDGKGMSAALWGAIVLKFNAATNALTVVKDLSGFELQSAYLVSSPSKTHVYGISDDAVYRIYTTGTVEAMFTVPEIHGGFTLVNNTYLYATEYNSKSSGHTGAVWAYNLAGEKIKSIAKPDVIDNYTMTSTAVAGPYVIMCTDSGAAVIKGTMVSGADPPGPEPPGPEPPTPTTEANVKFIIADETEFYFIIDGTGTTVMKAFQDAAAKYNYSGFVKYGGSSDEPSTVDSIFGLTSRKVDSTRTQYWISMVWDSDDSEWYPAPNTMDMLSAEENPSFLLYYGTNDGMSATAPASLPAGTTLTPLIQSNEGTRFMIESALGCFFVINGTGSTSMDAFENACTVNSIPYLFTGDEVKLFTISAKDGYAWRTFLGSSDGWSETTSIATGSASSSLFGLYFCESGKMPTILASNVFNFPSSDDILGEIVKYAAITAVLILLIVVIAYLVRIKRTQPMGVMAYLRMTLKRHNPSGSKIKHNKLKLLIVCLIGLLATFAMFLCTLAVGPSVNLSLADAFSALISASGKNATDLDFNEIIVYQSRLPRAIAALAVGIGLSVAGCVYQAIIRNPLVDPYIMGVSSGAGTFAVAAIAANFTFFGLLTVNNFTTPILAIIGGLLAFGLTLLIAEKAGGSSTNYVLAGVVIGLVFSAIQTLLLVTSTSEKLTSAISWLFGSFANVGWDTVWIIFFPAMFLSLVPLFWAKELNLVLLGEDQAKQMGLDVRKFNRWMLILASVLTSVCVAFVGIIGFVGMVIPHLSRMLLGGDHRLVLPASIMMGGALMLFADLMAKMLMIPTELPVGAITTIIGVPVFAYLLIKKGRMYSG